jgi:hypothetical protein
MVPGLRKDHTMNIAATVKRAPKWAWYTAGGLGLGAAAIKLYHNRGDQTSQDVTNTAADTIGPDGAQTVGGGTTSGVIVPPVILGGSTADPNAGAGVLQDLYVGAAGDLFSAWENLLGPVMSTQNSLLLGNADTISQIAMAGGAPQSQPTPVVSAPPLPQHVPVALAPKPGKPEYTVRHERRTRDNGKSGKARIVWCNDVTIHDYPNKPDVVVSEVKVKNGAC